MKRLLLFIAALLMASVVGKAQITLSIGKIQTTDTLVKVPVYVTGADTINPLYDGLYVFNYDTTKLVYKNLRDSILSFSITSNVPDLANGGFYQTGLESSSYEWYFPNKGVISSDFFVTNFTQGCATPVNNGAKTRLFCLVFAYHGPGTASISFDTTKLEFFGLNGQYTITYENGSVSTPTAVQGPTLYNPANNSTNVSFTPTFTWSPVSGATGYKVQVSSDSLFASTVIDQSVTDTTYTATSILQMNTNYYWRAAALTSGSTTTWSANVFKFKTKNIAAPMLTTSVATAITLSGATTGGVIVDDGNSAITERGVIYSDMSNVTWSNKLLSVPSLVSTSTFPVLLTGLSSNTTYYVKAYAINQAGTGLGDEISFTTLKPVFKATLTTKAATNLTLTGADLGGVITSAGNGVITERGVYTKIGAGVDSTSDKHAIIGGNDFVGTISNLASATTYSVKAYAVNEAGIGFGNELTFTTITPITAPVITISPATNVTDKAATINAEITSAGNGAAVISERGAIYAKSAGVTMSNKLGSVQSGSGAGVFSTNISGLISNTTYYVKAYATNQSFTSLSSEISFTTVAPIVKATISTTLAQDVSMTTAKVGGNITNAGNGTISARGIVYGLSANVDMATKDGSTNEGAGVGSFTSTLSGLNVYTTYYAKAYAVNEAGIAYGNEIIFQTLSQIFPPTVITYNASAITTNGATAAGNVTSSGNGYVSEKGILLALDPGVSMTNSIKKFNCNAGVGPFSATLTGLTNKTIYYVKAYATNEAGTTLGNEISFETLQGIIAVIPTVESSAITNIKSTTALGGGNITKDGNSQVTERGLIWATNSGVTMSNQTGKTSLTRTGIGSFTATMASLTPATTYYVKAYAKNIVGYGFGSELSFTSLATLATVTTNAVTAISQNTAISGGVVVDAGAAKVTERGVVYSTDNTFSTLNIVASGAGLGSYSSNLLGLTANATYSVKAYATNLYGTAFGAALTFTTLQNPNSTITAVNLSSSKFPFYANGALETINYTLGGSFASDNKFVAELSDENGLFTAPTIIGQNASNANGSISLELPFTLTNGTNYAIRLRSTNPNMIYSNAITGIKIKAIKDYLTNSNPSACAGQSVSIGINAASFEGADRYTYSWTSPALLDNATDINPKYLNPSLGSAFTVYFIPKKAGEQITSKLVTVSIVTPNFGVTTSPWTVVNNAVTSGNIASSSYANPSISGSPLGSIIYKWYSNSVAPANLIDPSNCSFNVGSNIYYMTATDGTGCSTAEQKYTVFRRAYRDGEISMGRNNSFMQVYPSPFENEINITANVGESTSAKVKLIDMLGNVAFERTLSVNNGEINVNVENINVNNGAYMLVLETENDVITSKVVKIK